MLYLLKSYSQSGPVLRISYTRTASQEQLLNQFKSYSLGPELLGWKDGNQLDRQSIHDTCSIYKISGDWFEYSTFVIDAFQNYSPHKQQADQKTKDKFLKEFNWYSGSFQKQSKLAYRYFSKYSDNPCDILPKSNLKTYLEYVSICDLAALSHKEFHIKKRYELYKNKSSLLGELIKYIKPDTEYTREQLRKILEKSYSHLGSSLKITAPITILREFYDITSRSSRSKPDSNHLKDQYFKLKLK